MDRCGWRLVAAILISLTLGCSKSSPTNTAEAKSAAAKLAQTGTPDQAVHEFLDAVKSGNDKKASFLLTEAARQKTTEMEMVVAPPGSDTATFEVGEVEYVTDAKDGAHVASKWTDLQGGQPHTDQIIWILRQETEGWRIAGMATKVFEDEPPLILNFEDPEDMMRKQKLAQEELERRAQQSHARQPDKSGAVMR